jgi:hypothetical protein
MSNSIVTHGEVIDKETIHLEKPLPIDHGKVKLVIEPEDMPKSRKQLFGIAKGAIIMHADFDAPIKDFKEYMKH